VILTVKTIEGTGMIENSQIVVAMLGSVGYSILGIATPGAAGTDKTSDTVAGQGVIIIRKIALVGATSDYLAVHNPTESTKANPALGDFTLMQAKLAGNSVLCPRGIFRQTVGFAGTRVNLLDLRPNILEVGPDTICTEAYYV
jgi:hypothetical protein